MEQLICCNAYATLTYFMKLQHLEINHFRNLERIDIDVGHRVNLLYGQNGSGKTSFLEALHYLGLGRSFRTRNITRIIQHNTPSFSIFALLSNIQHGSLPIGMQRGKDTQSLTLKIGGKQAQSMAELAQLFPVQFINADSHMLLASGPQIRRQFLDWGVFHVEPSFYPLWQRINRTLKQRNAQLKLASNYAPLAVWDDVLEECAVSIDNHRRNYVASLQAILGPMLESLLSRSDFSLDYHRGWNQTKTLTEALASSFARDKQMGFTQLGPQRADLQLKIANAPAHELLSQGQQKLAAYALRLSQTQLLLDCTGKKSILLIDDLPSELDKDSRLVVTRIIMNLDLQSFITGIELEELNHLIDVNSQTFHVERGTIYHRPRQ